MKRERALHNAEPKCFWRTGLATYDMTRMDASAHMRMTDDVEHPWVPRRGADRILYTDGSYYTAGSSGYAGWGVYDPTGEASSYGALKGWEQTAAKAEVRALVAAVEPVHDYVCVYSDNQYTVNTANAIRRGEQPNIDAHHDLWDRFKARAHRVRDVIWIKSHMSPEQAQRRGFTEAQRLGNEGADELAKLGSEEHGYSPGQKSRAKRAIGLIKRVQIHMANTYVRYINNSAVKADSKYHRKPKLGVVRTKRRGRPPQDPATRGHLVEGDEHRQHCKRCGRITIAKDKHKFWVDHQCEVLPTYAKGLEKGHTLEVGSEGKRPRWTCSSCGLKGGALESRQCNGEPGGKRRGGPQEAAEGRPGPPKRARVGAFLSSSLV